MAAATRAPYAAMVVEGAGWIIAAVLGGRRGGPRAAPAAVMTTCVHLVARAEHLPVSLVDDAVAPRLWRGLERGFPLALAAVLMPNHIHLLVQLAGLTVNDAADEARARLGAVLRSLSRAGGPAGAVRFAPIPRPVPEDDPVKILRQARYIALNPVRADLVRDPLLWTWSTHRDVVGAVAHPWVTARRLAEAVGRRADDFAPWWHRYVAREDGLDVSARSFPVAARPSDIADVPLTAVVRASASALRTRPEDVRRRGPTRRLVLALAPLLGWDRSRLLATVCGVTPRAIQLARHRAPPGALDAALLCLGDERLR